MDTKPFIISSKLTQPAIDQYIEALSYTNVLSGDQSIVYDDHTCEILDKVFAALDQIKPSSDGRRTLWLCANRGSTEDIAQYDGSPEKPVDDRAIEDLSNYEQHKQVNYPNGLAWYHFSSYEDSQHSYRSISLQHQRILVQKNDKPSYPSYEEVSDLAEWILESVRNSIEAVRAGVYNQTLMRELPAKHRTGIILRKHLWELYPDACKEFYKNLTQSEVDAFLACALDDPNDLEPRLPSLTANDYFRFCSLGYQANRYPCADLTPRQQYLKYADGRDGGLTDLDPDSPQAFAEWYQSQMHLGFHPWEVVRGGSTTHIDLYVEEDSNGFYLYVVGTSTWRSAESIKFFLALHEAGVPVIIHKAQLLKDRLSGQEKVGVAPHGVFPAYCHTDFPEEEQIEAFTHLSDDFPDKMAALCDWLPLPHIELLQPKGGEAS